MYVQAKRIECLMGEVG